MHMRTGRGLDKAVETIRALDLKSVQIFTDNPSAWRSAPVDPRETALFKKSLSDLDVRPAEFVAMAFYGAVEQVLTGWIFDGLRASVEAVFAELFA